MKLIRIPAGEFSMGAESEYDHESPIHTVYLDEYWIDQSEVTLGQFAQFMGETGYVAYPLAEGDEYPVGNITWFDAQAYCEWAGRRLPTEAEWEKAARGGLEGKKYPWGDEDPVCRTESENGAQFDECEGESKPVNSFSPNGYGLFDMAGNVYEWASDWYAADYYQESPLKNPLGPNSGEVRIVRGGGWFSYMTETRVAYRVYYSPEKRLDVLGFRCASSAESP